LLLSGRERAPNLKPRGFNARGRARAICGAFFAKTTAPQMRFQAAARFGNRTPSICVFGSRKWPPTALKTRPRGRGFFLASSRPQSDKKVSEHQRQMSKKSQHNQNKKMPDEKIAKARIARFSQLVLSEEAWFHALTNLSQRWDC
jgi:hypothetical protein